MTTHYLYLISLPLPDRRRYVGRTNDPTRRFDEHYNAPSLIGEAIRRDGPENCKFEIIFTCSEDEILGLEALAIDELGTRHPYGCNCKGGSSRRSVSPEVRKQFLETLESRGLRAHGVDRNRVGPVVVSASEKPAIAPAPKRFTSANGSDPQDETTLDALSTSLDVIIELGAASEKSQTGGWVKVTASPQGRNAFERKFPGWVFGWQRVQLRPRRDWWSVSLDPQSLVRRSIRFKHGRLKRVCTAKFASWLAHVASDQGARAALLLDSGNGRRAVHFVKSNSQRTTPTSAAA